MPHAFLYADRPPMIPLGCSKSSFPSRKKALRVMDNMPKTGEFQQISVGRINVYLCPECQSWHIGQRAIRSQEKK